MSADIVVPNSSEIDASNDEVLGPTILEAKAAAVDLPKERKKSLRARFYYGLIFLSTNLIAWFVRDYDYGRLLQNIPSCGTQGIACVHTMGVLRVSLGCFIFFFTMFLTTIYTSKLYEARNIWHSGWWPFKLFLLILSLAIPLFFPSDLLHLYGEFARVGAGIFLALQLISVIQFIAWWNNHWMPDHEEAKKQSCSVGLFMSTMFYIGSVCGIIMLAKLYSAGQPINVFFITWTIILLVVMMVISLHSKVNRGLLSSGIMGSYIVFLCWSAIRSEPDVQRSNMQQPTNHHDWSTILSFLIAIGAIVMATFSTGIDSESFQFRKDEVQLEDDIPYKYEFFHLVFSLGAMYFAMLFISWNLENNTKKWVIDVGWTSTWVKIVNEWFAATIYLWLLISPVVRQVKVVDEETAERAISNSTSP